MRKPAYKDARIQGISYRLLRDSVTRSLARLGLTMTGWVLLGTLKEHGALRLSRLAKFLDLEPPQITILIHELEQKGFVSRTADINDARAKEVALADKGISILKEAEGLVDTQVGKLMRGIKRQEIDMYFSVLERILRNAGHQ